MTVLKYYQLNGEGAIEAHSFMHSNVSIWKKYIQPNLASF